MTTKDASQDMKVIEVWEKMNNLVKYQRLPKWLEEPREKTLATLSKVLESVESVYGYVAEEIDVEELKKVMQWAENLAVKWAEKGYKEKGTVAEIPSIEVDTRYIALVAHNNMKIALKSFVEAHQDFFSNVPLVTTGSTGKALNESLGINVAKGVASGPLGGDQEIGGMISQEKIAAIFFFKDPLSAHPHAADIEALTRLCDVHQIPYATNPGTAIALLMGLQKLGTDWQLAPDENSVVEKYKQEQAKVIQTVSK